MCVKHVQLAPTLSLGLQSVLTAQLVTTLVLLGGSPTLFARPVPLAPIPVCLELLPSPLVPTVLLAPTQAALGSTLQRPAATVQLEPTLAPLG